MVTITDSHLRDLRRAAEQARSLRDEAAASATDYCMTAAVSAMWPALIFESIKSNRLGGHETAAQMVADARNALFGAWRVGFVGWDEKEYKDVIWSDQRVAKQHFQWYDVFRLGLAAALYVGDSHGAAEIAAYTDGPDDELPIWSAEISPIYTADARTFYVELSKLVCDRPADMAALAKFDARMPHRRDALLRACLLALVSGDTFALVKTLAEYLDFYWKRERDREIPAEVVSVDGTILYHVAALRFGRAPELGAELEPMIARRRQPGAVR